MKRPKPFASSGRHPYRQASMQVYGGDAADDKSADVVLEASTPTEGMCGGVVWDGMKASRFRSLAQAGQLPRELAPYMSDHEFVAVVISKANKWEALEKAGTAIPVPAKGGGAKRARLSESNVKEKAEADKKVENENDTASTGAGPKKKIKKKKE